MDFFFKKKKWEVVNEAPAARIALFYLVNCEFSMTFAAGLPLFVSGAGCYCLLLLQTTNQFIYISYRT